MRTGGCHCGDVRYEVAGDPLYHSLCHCSDCRASAGAPAVAWLAFAKGGVRLTQGSPATYVGKGGAERQFCPRCGTGLLYANAAVIPGVIDVQTCTLDEPGDEPSDGPAVQIQCVEKLGWFDGLAALPGFDRYPALPE